VIVLSNNDGCAISRTDEAKALGVAMGTPAFMIQEKIRQHDIAVFSSNYTLYNDMSERVMQTMGAFVPGMEIYSIDEAFLDMHDLPWQDLLRLGTDIRNTVLRNTGIPVSVGIAPTRTLAKMANRYAKKKHQHTGVFFAAHDALIAEMLACTEVQDIWGIGKKHAELLKRNGIHTAAELAATADPWILKHLTVVGARMVNELRGIPSIAWADSPQKRKNIATTRSFGDLIDNRQVLIEAVANHAASCAAKLRLEQSVATKVHVLLQTNPHRIQDKQFARTITLELPLASNDNSSIIKAALKGLSLIYHPGYKYKKCGVIVMDLLPQEKLQGSFFENANRSKLNALMKTVDSINQVKGRETVRMGVQAGEKKYRLRASHLSRPYTTDIHQLPETE